MDRSSFIASALALSTASALPASAAGEYDARFDALAQTALASGRAPGFSVAVVDGGSVVYAKGFGVADIVSHAPVTPDTAFAVGSISKQFVAAVVLQIVAERRLRLDDPLATWEPALPNAAQITLRDLLQQTSGLHNYPLLSEHPWPTTGAVTTRAIVDVLSTDPPDFTPGTRYAYSNANYAVLTAIVERVENAPFARVLRDRITAPLGMTSTGFGSDATARLSAATPYAGSAPFARQPSITLDLFSGAGAIVSTAADMASSDLALLRGAVLDDASRTLAFSAGRLRDGTPIPYAMGWVPERIGGQRSVWHNGLAPGAGGYCYNVLYPDDALAVVVLSNGFDFTGQPERLARGVLNAYVPSAAQAM